MSNRKTDFTAAIAVKFYPIFTGTDQIGVDKIFGYCRSIRTFRSSKRIARLNSHRNFTPRCTGIDHFKVNRIRLWHNNMSSLWRTSERSPFLSSAPLPPSPPPSPSSPSLGVGSKHRNQEGEEGGLGGWGLGGAESKFEFPAKIPLTVRPPRLQSYYSDFGDPLLNVQSAQFWSQCW